MSRGENTHISRNNQMYLDLWGSFQLLYNRRSLKVGSQPKKRWDLLSRYTNATLGMGSG